MFKAFLNNLFTLKKSKRSDQIVYSLLVIFLVVIIFLFLSAIASKLTMGENYHGGSLLCLFILIIFFSGLIHFFRRGYRRFASYIIFLIIFLGSLNVVWMSGPENPYAILLMILYIIGVSMVFSGIIFITSILLLIVSYSALLVLQLSKFITPDLSWKTQTTNPGDIIGIIIVLLFIIYISWLFNREINNYISRLEESQKLLKKERDILEERVSERTAQLQAEQLDRLVQLSKFAEFGRLAQGLFHDLINPLTALSLNLDQIKKEKDSSKIKEYFKETSIAADNMKKLIDSSLNYSQNKIAKSSFSIANELKNIELICGYKARQAEVELVFQEKNDIKLVGNRTRFSQLICNLVLNAIEAYEQQKNKIKDNTSKKVSVNFVKEKSDIILRVLDNALGMPENVRKNIFESFYSTKKHIGHSGIGLSTCIDIVESDFLGQMKVKSKLGEGSEFIITIPEAIQRQE